MPHPHVCIAGAGIIGLSLALELHRRGIAVIVLDAGQALRQTSFAAAGMLAVNDPANPAALAPLSSLSASLYPAFLDRIADLSGDPVPFQTDLTLQIHTTTHTASSPGTAATPATASSLSQADLDLLAPGNNLDPAHITCLPEHSVDPRQLGRALLAAVRNTSIDLRENTSLHRIRSGSHTIHIETSGASIEAAFLVDCMGTWSPAPVSPRKGQMLAVRPVPGVNLDLVLRAHDIYLVPRTAGPDAGRIVIGATIEDAGFNLDLHPPSILALYARALQLFPALARAEFLESWAGLRPSTTDGLPILGVTPAQPLYVLSTGHFRNGILLAPATAHLLADLLTGIEPSVDLRPFSPERFLPRKPA